MKRAIIYHAKCNDGITAAAVALSRLEMQYPGRAEETGVFACNYGYDFPKEIPLGCEEVFIVDFSFPPDVMYEVADRMPSTEFWVIDHHASAIEKYDSYEMPSNVHLEFDTGPGISGASMAWKHFFPNTEAPDLVLDVADRDTWVFDRPNTKAIHQALLNLDSRTPERVSDFIFDTTDGQLNSYEKLVSIGTTLLDSYNKNLAEIHQTAFYREFKKMGPYENLRVVLVNCPYHFISDMAEYIREHDDRYTEDMLFIGFVVRKNGVSLSFRSEQNLAKPVAEHYSGGGHPNSGGANVTYGTLIDILTSGQKLKPPVYETKFYVMEESVFKSWTSSYSEQSWACVATLAFARGELPCFNSSTYDLLAPDIGYVMVCLEIEANKKQPSAVMFVEDNADYVYTLDGTTVSGTVNGGRLEALPQLTDLVRQYAGNSFKI